MFGMPDLRRLALWGVAACGALLLAIYAGTTQSGRERIVVAVTQAREIIHPSAVQPVRALSPKEGRQLAERVRFLLADRDDLITRLALVERGAEETKSSIARVEKVAEEVKSVQQAMSQQAMAAPAAPPNDVTASIGTTEPATAASAADKAEFGLDLGGALTLEGLRKLWANAQRRHGAQLDGLRPIVHLRERPRPNPPDLRLVAGPIANAAAAARLCSALAAAGALCQPAAFDGQRLAVR